MDIFKLIVVVLLLGIVGSLASALVYLFKDSDDSKRTVRALTVRISLSVAFFVLLISAYLLGFIQPHQMGGG